MILVRFGRLSAILAHVEHTRRDADPFQVSRQLFRYVRLATRRQTDHCDHVWNVNVRCRPIACDGHRQCKW